MSGHSRVRNVHDGYPVEFVLPLEQQVCKRVAALALLRELQLNGETDIMLLRQRLQPTQEGQRALLGALNRYVIAGGIAGQVAGMDGRYPYKHWRVVDVKKMRFVSTNCRLPLMTPEGKQSIRER